MPKIIDRLLKSLAVDDPRALYCLLSEPLPPEDADITPMIQEIFTKLSLLDYWCVFRAGDRERADVFEFKGKYESSMQRQLLKYGMATFVATEMAVRATVIVVSEKRFPKGYQELEPIERAGARIEFRTVRLWDLDAALALELSRPSLLSLVPFMRHTWAQAAEAARRIPAGARDALDMFWHALILRYSRKRAEQFQLEVGMNSAIMERIWNELLPDSPWAESIRDEARLESARNMVARVLRRRFPEVEPGNLAAVSSLDDLDEAVDDLIGANSAEEARRVVARLTAG